MPYDEILRDLHEAPRATSQTTVTLANQLREAQAELDEVKARQKACQARVDDLRKRQLPDAMAELGLTSFKLTSGETVYLRTEVHVGCAAERRPELLAWLEAHGHGALISQSVHPKTLDSWYREQVDNQAPVPDFLSVYKEPAAVLKKS